jgi:hypothetical protein
MNAADSVPWYGRSLRAWALPTRTQSHDLKEVIMIPRTLSRLAMLATGVWVVQHLVQARRAQRALSATKPTAVQAWEGEGGAVPVGGGRTAAAVTPSGRVPGP